ncbi:MAG: T9SS type A sorting domain-containing protein [Bacteroidota bacterium]
MDEDYEYSNILVHKAIKDGILNFFPNPVSHHMIIELDQTTDSDLEVQLFDIAGRLMELVSAEISGSQIYLNNVSDLEKGTYFLIVSSKHTGSKYQLKFIKD